ncbi:LEF-3 [Drosophila innubila nudivirus]|uniref:LEF-3 n=1 Tax=Drosophila innubila nudivirus TaxID=2057187 RepID=A0A2H4UX65_9VIRU|nr:LEF-3 [Drosophila innubila nudivirus]ATZ81511.1 LEF-3 [Drosophila innubila nudivirus]
MMVVKKIKQELSVERNARNINIAISAIPLCKLDTKCVNAIFHKSLTGNILIGLNSNNLPVIAWRDINGIVPIRAKIVKSSAFREIINRLHPKCLYLNDGEALRPLSTLKYDSLKMYTDKNLLEILKDLKIEIATTSRGHDLKEIYESNKITGTFAVINNNNNNTTMTTNTDSMKLINSNNVVADDDNGNNIDNNDNDTIDGGCINTNTTNNTNNNDSTNDCKNDIVDKPPTFNELRSMEPSLTRREYFKFCKEFELQLSIKTTHEQYKNNPLEYYNMDSDQQPSQKKRARRHRRRRRRC